MEARFLGMCDGGAQGDGEVGLTSSLAALPQNSALPDKLEPPLAIYSQDPSEPPMFAFLFAVPVVLSLNSLIFDDGQQHRVTEQDVSPGDQLYVRGGPPDMTSLTVLTTEGNARYELLAVGWGGQGFVIENSQVDGYVHAGLGGTLTLGGHASIGGELSLGPGGTGWITTSGTIGGLVQVRAATLRALSNAHLLDRLQINGDATVGNATIDGTTLLFQDADATFTGTRFNGDVQVIHNPRVDFDQVEAFGAVSLGSTSEIQVQSSVLHGPVTLDGNAPVRFGTNNSIASTVRMLGQSIAYVTMRTANVPAGPVTATSGVISGTNPDGSATFFAFDRDPGATLILEVLASSVGTTVCSQSILNSTGAVAHVEAIGSDVAGANDLELVVTDMPMHAFAFFFTGTQTGSNSLPNGEICVGGNIGRYLRPGEVMNSGADGSISLELDLTDMPGNPGSSAMAGDTFVFQAWIRDNFPSGPSFRFSDATAVQFR